jgi:hypothetical protein
MPCADICSRRPVITSRPGTLSRGRGTHHEHSGAELSHHQSRAAGSREPWTGGIGAVASDHGLRLTVRARRRE